MNKPNPVQRGLLFLMKVTLIHILVSSFSLVMAHPLTSLSQGILDKKVSINIENTKVQAALSLLSEEADVKFTYSPSLFSTSQSITLHMTDVKLATVLEALLNPGISYKVIGNQIALNPGDLAPNPPRTITGKIVDEKGEDLPGASVVVKGTTNGTITDATGKFTLNNVEDDAVLQISSIGYKTQEVNAGQETIINAKMEPDITELSEVVVIGYGEVKKSDITGSVGSVSAEDLTAYPVPNIAMGLQGKTAGVVVQQNSGAPGSGISVRIRGGNSLQGSSEPLYVVDGFALNGDPSAINPADIESMEVLKDASSTAIYGSRGANGVVLITTKKGKAGSQSITFDSYFAMQKVGKLLDLMNASEFAQLANERLTNDGFAPQFTTDQVAQFGEGTNWQNEIYRSAPMQSHTVTVSGGSNKSQYSVSGSLLDQNGIVIGSNQQRQSLRASMNQSLGNNDKVKLGVNIVLTNTSVGQLNADNGQKGSTVTSAAVGAPPTVDVYNPDGTYTNVQAYPWSSNNLVHPVAFAIERTQQSNTKYILANTALSYEPIKGLILKTTAGVETNFAKTKTYSPTIIFNTPTGQASIAYAEGLNFLNENTVAYSKQFGGIHELSGLGGFTFQRNVGENTNTGNVSGFTTDALGADNLQSGSVSTIPSSGYSKWILLSYLGRVNYSLNGKYLFTASIRADGSSRFGNGNKWGTFPSGAVAWRIIEENFMKQFNFLSDMKIRASYGVTGSTALNPYQTLSSLTPLTTVFNDSQFTGYGPSLTALANPDLKWETTAQSDVGLDIGLLSNRVSITTDYYVKNTRDLLQSVSIPTSTGFSSTIRNIGKVRNSGVEFALNVIAIDTKNFKWKVNGNISRNVNKVLALANGADVFGQPLPQPLSVAVNLVRVGEPAGVFYGYKEDGLNATTGAVKYKDQDGDGVITLTDRTIIGNPNPKFVYNFGSSITYSNFQLDFTFMGKYGGNIFNQNLSSQGSSMYFGENQLKEVFYDHWKPSDPNPDAKYAKISANTTYQASDRFVENASFLRLRSLQLAYNFHFKTPVIKGLQVYVSGTNLLTFTKYSWYDPEVSTLGGSNSISIGIDNSAYPNAKLFTTGVRFNL